ncbi:MAG: hypothetical protein ACK4L7_07630 [Flavobacteriales bacterium]
MRAVSIAAFTLLAACGGQADQAPDPGQHPTAVGMAVDLSGHDVPIIIGLGDAAALGVDSAEVRWSEESGQLMVRAGDRFGLLITEEPGDIARLKADLERDQLRTSTIIEERPDRLVWRSAFPDEDLVFVHFYRIVQADGRTFIVQDDDHGRYSEADVARMIGSVRPKQPM